MLKWLKRIGLALAVAFLALTVINASWLAAPPKGYAKLLAQRGTMQQFSHQNLGKDDCTATRIEVPVHDYLENTLPGLQMADGLGAYMIAVDIAPTADGRIALFHDRTLDCRTNGTGEVRAATLAQLKALDAGYGYTADGGKTFPLRGKTGYIPSIEEAVAVVPAVPLLYTLTGNSPDEAQLLITALKGTGREVVKIGDAFFAPEAELPAIRAAFPGVWAFSAAGIKTCTKAYLLSGWFTIVPAACQGGTIAVPLNYQWAFAGWPNKLQARVAAAGGHVILTGPGGSDEEDPVGLDLPEQLGQVPSTFTGTVWVDDMWVIGPALHPAANHRNAREEAETAAGLAARRKGRE